MIRSSRQLQVSKNENKIVGKTTLPSKTESRKPIESKFKPPEPVVPRFNNIQVAENEKLKAAKNSAINVDDYIADWKKCVDDFRSKIVLKDTTFINFDYYDENKKDFRVKFEIGDLLEWHISSEIMVEEEAFEIFNYLQEIERRFLFQMIKLNALSNSIPDKVENEPVSSGLAGRFVKQLNSAPKPIPIAQRITSRVRYIVVDWIVDLHLAFELSPETLFLTVTLMDIYLSLKGKTTSKNEIQVISLACFFIASKFEEMLYVTSADISKQVDCQISSTQIVEYERRVLKAVGYRLTFPTPITFERRFCRMMKSSDFERSLSKYFMELTLTEIFLASKPPSLIAATCCCLSRLLTLIHFKVTGLDLNLNSKEINENSEIEAQIVKNEPNIDVLEIYNQIWNGKMQFHTTYSVDDLLPCLSKLASVISRQQIFSKQRSIRDKYALPNFGSISAHYILKLKYLDLIESQCQVI